MALAYPSGQVVCSWPSGCTIERSCPAYSCRDQYLHELGDQHQIKLTEFVETLPTRLVQLEACGMPETLVHGDYHPGNWRGIVLDLTILDRGDCGTALAGPAAKPYVKYL